MFDAMMLPLFLAAVLVLYVLSSINILREYERAVIFRLGRALPEPKGPGSASRCGRRCWRFRRRM
jgi:regulator of protease activity HflC (stomatin/prohibitin superfamily)